MNTIRNIGFGVMISASVALLLVLETTILIVLAKTYDIGFIAQCKPYSVFIFLLAIHSFRNRLGTEYDDDRPVKTRLKEMSKRIFHKCLVLFIFWGSLLFVHYIL